MLRNHALLWLFVLAVLTAFPVSEARSAGDTVWEFDFSAFNEADWISARDAAVPEIGRFVQKDGYIQNYVKPEHRGLHTLEAGHALRLLKDDAIDNVRIETELMLVGKAAPSIYFNTQLDGDVHQETYNLVVFDFSTPENKHYYGLNLWKWQKTWPKDVRPSAKHWVKLASWAFPVPLNKKHKLTVDKNKRYITVYLNGQLKGTVYDANPLPPGRVGLCSCEGVNNFYSLKVTKRN